MLCSQSSKKSDILANEANKSMAEVYVMKPVVVGDANGEFRINHDVIRQIYPILAEFYGDKSDPFHQEMQESIW